MRLDSVITLHADELSETEWRKLLNALTFVDKDEVEVMAYDFHSAREEIVIPRGALNLLPRGLKITDMRSRPNERKVGFLKELDAIGADGQQYKGQRAALAAMFKKEQGQIRLAPGSGKTEIGLAFACMCRTRTLVVVHTHDLLRQWRDRAKRDAPGLDIGYIHGDRAVFGQLTIATAQTLRNYVNAGGKFWRQFGCLIVDESHHAAAETWEWILNVSPAYYRFGLSASDKRSDGRQLLVNFNVGPIIYRMPFESQVPITVIPVKTGFRSHYSGEQYSLLIRELVEDEKRNKRIANLVKDEVARGSTVLVLSRQIKHLELIYEQLIFDYPYNASQVQIVTGRLPKRMRDKYIEGLRDGSIRCVFGTQLFEEGVDIPRLNCIILAFPGTDITVLQKVGRGARAFKDKTSLTVYDILDDFVPTLVRQFMERKAWYRQQKKSITIGKAVGHGTEENEKRTLSHLIHLARRGRPARTGSAR